TRARRARRPPRPRRRPPAPPRRAPADRRGASNAPPSPEHVGPRFPRAPEPAARVRLESARRPWIRWLAVGLCALVVGLTVQHQQGSLERARRAWGERQTVLVALHPVARGATLGPH